MAHNSFGNIFKFTTFGESHGKALGVVVDGCPSGIELTLDDIQDQLNKRAPGKTAYTSPRNEKDQVEILSGLFEGKTTGAPIALVVYNQDADSSKYHSIQHLYRPGHANYTYEQKYKVFDYRGGGRASARETLARVAAGAIAKKILQKCGIHLAAYITQIGNVKAQIGRLDAQELAKQASLSSVYCPDQEATKQMQQHIVAVKEQGDSLGGIVEVVAEPMPLGLGDPVYEKLEANLAKAMMSIPASKGVEFGAGFEAALMKGSEHNDEFYLSDQKVETKTNHAGGTLGGISNGMPLCFRVAFKPTSSIQLSQPTLSHQGESATLTLPKGSRHDPCVAIRATVVVEAMTAVVLADAYLMNRAHKL